MKISQYLRVSHRGALPAVPPAAACSIYQEFLFGKGDNIITQIILKYVIKKCP